MVAAELSDAKATATFFVLGELARDLAGRLRELAEAGHEIACHGYHHLRANDLSPRDFLTSIGDARHLLEDLVGAPVRGFRAPEWSLRDPWNPRLRAVAEAGFAYDSSLVRAAGAGNAANPEAPSTLSWEGREHLIELPPLTWAGRFRLPASGWCGRLAAPRWILRAVREATRAGRLPLLVVHPWELVDRPVPGLYTGLARLFHDAGRGGYRLRFRELLAGSRWRSIATVLAESETRARGAAPAPPETADTEIGGLSLPSPEVVAR
jgi:hypothetical protein